MPFAVPGLCGRAWGTGRTVGAHNPSLYSPHHQISKIKGKKSSPHTCRETYRTHSPGQGRALGGLQTGEPGQGLPAGRGPEGQSMPRPGPGPALPPQPPHLVLSTLDSKGQKRTTILFTGRSTTRILDAIFFLPSPSTTTPSSPLAQAGNGGGRHLGNVVRGGLPLGLLMT